MSERIQLDVVEYKKEKKIPSGFPDIKDISSSSGIILNSEESNPVLGTSLMSDQDLLTEDSQTTRIEKSKPDRTKIMNIVKLAHDQAEETRKMLQRLSNPDEESKLQSNLSVDDDSTRIVSNTVDIATNGIDENPDNFSYSTQDSQKKDDEGSTLMSPEARRLERARLIAEAKAKAAQEKKSLMDKKEQERLEKKKERQLQLSSQLQHSQSLTGASISSPDDPEDSSVVSKPAVGNGTNSSRYAAVLSISKEEARKAAVAKVRTDSKKTAEAKAKAEILSREAKLKALLSADREARLQKRLSESGGAQPQPASPKAQTSVSEDVSGGFKDIGAGGTTVTTSVSTLMKDAPVSATVLANNTSATNDASDDVDGNGGGSGSGKESQSIQAIRMMHGQESMNGNSVDEKEDVADQPVIPSGNDAYNPDMDHSLRKGAIQQAACWTGNDNNGNKTKLGFWDSLFMCSNADKLW